MGRKLVDKDRLWAVQRSGASGKEKRAKAAKSSELRDQAQHFSRDHGAPQSVFPDLTGNQAGLKLHL